MAFGDTTELLASVRRRAMIPSDREGMTTTDLLALATEELQTTVAAFLVSLNEEFLVSSVDQAVTANSASYTIPERASGSALRQVLILDGTEYVPLSRVEPEREHYWGADSDDVGAYKLEDCDLTLVPTPTVSATLRLRYHRRPSKLVETSAVGTIQAINTGTKTVTFTSTNPSTFSTSQTFDLIGGTPPFKVLAIDQTATSVSGSDVTFTNTLPSGLAVGDYVALATESPVPQVTSEVHPWLCQLTAARALEALGDAKGDKARAVADRMRNEVMALLTPRVVGSARPIINYHGPGWGGRGAWRR